MKILLWHGYLLSGSGSNIYTRNVAAEWRKQGHDVLLLCQERHPERTGVVDGSGDFDPDNRTFTLVATGAPGARGRCRVLRPAIGEVLPVYVFDEYEGFTARRFVDLSDDELGAYVERNVEAMVTAIRDFEPDAVITGHEVMGPYIAKLASDRAGGSFVAKLHGSALEYAVKERPGRYLPYAVDGLSAARTVTGGSRYMVEAAASVITGWRHKARVVNPGADVELFRPVHRAEPERPVVGFVGKLILNKGVHDLLCAAPLLGRPVDLVVVGYGDHEERLRRLAAILAEGDLDGVRSWIDAVPDERLAAMRALFGGGSAGRAYAERARSLKIRFTGRLDHGPLSRVLPTFDLLAVPSILAEAFGMVAVEAAACGVLPVVPSHSGIGEVGAELERALEVPGMLTYDPSDPILGLARTVEGLLELPFAQRRALAMRASEIAHERWSWQRCAEGLLRAAID